LGICCEIERRERFRGFVAKLRGEGDFGEIKREIEIEWRLRGDGNCEKIGGRSSGEGE